MYSLEKFIEDWFLGYPRMGEIRRYKVVPMTDEDIAKEKIEEIEKQIEKQKIKLEALERELKEEKRKLK